MIRWAIGVLVLACGCGGNREMGTPEPPLDPWPVASPTRQAEATAHTWKLHMAPGVRFEHLHIRCAAQAIGEMAVDDTRVIDAPEGCAIHGESIDDVVDFALPDGAPGDVVCDAAGQCTRME